MKPETGKWFTLPAGLDNHSRRVLPAYLVDVGASRACVLAVPIWVVEINRAEGWVRYLSPNQPFDVERVAPFDHVHGKLESALAAVGHLLPELHILPENSLQDVSLSSPCVLRVDDETPLVPRQPERE